MTSSQYMSGRQVYNRPQAILFADNYGTNSNGLYVPSGNEFGNTLNDSGDFLILSDHNRSTLDFGIQRIENRQRMVNGRMRSYWVADKRTLSVSWNMLPSRSYALKPIFNTPVSIYGATWISSTSVKYSIILPKTDVLPFNTTNKKMVAIQGGNVLNFNSAEITAISSSTSNEETVYEITVSVSGAINGTYTSGAFMYLLDTAVGDSPYDKTDFSYTVDGGAGGAELLDWYENHNGTFYVFLAYDKFTEFGKDNAAYAHLNQYQEVLEMYITDFQYSVQKRGGSNFDMWNISISLEEA